jgi:O-antigen ligase
MGNTYPFFGVGFNCYNVSYNAFDFSNGKYGRSRSVHSAFFGVLAEGGYVGAALYGVMLLAAIRSCRRVRRLADAYPTLLPLGQGATAMETGFIAFIVGASFVPLQYTEMLWHYIGYTIVLERLATHEVLAAASVQSEPDATVVGTYGT